MSTAPSKSKPALTILITLVMILGTVAGSANITEDVIKPAEDQGVDDQYSSDNYTFRGPGHPDYLAGENSFGTNTLRGTNHATSTPNLGETFDSYSWGRNTIQTVEGMKAADNTWAVAGTSYSNSRHQGELAV